MRAVPVTLILLAAACPRGGGEVPPADAGFDVAAAADGAAEVDAGVLADAMAPADAASGPDASPNDSCANWIVSTPGFSPCSTDAECTDGDVCSPYAWTGISPLVCMPPCLALDICPLSGPYGCSSAGPSGISACVKLNGPSDALDCCDGMDSNGNGYVDEGACDPAGGIGCYTYPWCGADGACIDGTCA